MNEHSLVESGEGTWYCSKHRGFHLEKEIPFAECPGTIPKPREKKAISTAYQEAMNWIGTHEGSIHGVIANGTIGSKREWGVTLGTCPVTICPLCTNPTIHSDMFQLRLYDKIMYVVHSHHESVSSCELKSTAHSCHKYDGQVLITE
jgi:hypothetical protein